MFLLSFLLLTIPLAKSENVTVDTTSGTVVGYLAYLDGTELNNFIGIPFAKPPVGDLRFRKPQPIEPWSEPLVAQNFPPACTQYYPYYYPWVDKNSKQSEDCLYLNIFVPRPESDRKSLKTVMFFIYGGSYSAGSINLGAYYGIEFVSYGDVILVTTNYRLGIFGFLSEGHEEAPGNMGFFDILTALKWVYENIEAFGGDKDRITVFGQGSGAATSALFTMSPLTKGLFKRIIMESGAPVQLAEDSHSNNFQLFLKTADAVGCYPKSREKYSSRKIVQCLRKIDAQNLTRVVYSINPEKMATFLPISGDTFLPVEPRYAVKIGLIENVNVLAGVVQDEGSVQLVSEFPDLFGPYGEKEPKINKTLGRQLILKMMKNLYFKNEVADHYLSGLDEDDYDTVRKQTYHSVGDLSVVCPTLYFMEADSQVTRGSLQGINPDRSISESATKQEKSKKYFYYYYHLFKLSTFQLWMGVTQYSEVRYVFAKAADRPHFYLPAEQELSKHMVKMWTDFAKTGVPSSEWKEYSKQDPFIQNFTTNVSFVKESTLKEHLENCEFYRPYLTKLQYGG